METAGIEAHAEVSVLSEKMETDDRGGETCGGADAERPARAEFELSSEQLDRRHAVLRDAGRDFAPLLADVKVDRSDVHSRALVDVREQSRDFSARHGAQ